MRVILIALCLSFVLISCARRGKPSQAVDLKADTKLGARYDEDEAEDVQKSLEEIREKQGQEQKRHLERQITEPLDEPQKT